MGSEEEQVNKRFRELGIDKDYDRLVVEIRDLLTKHFDGHIMAIMLAVNDKEEMVVELALAGAGEMPQEQTYNAFGSCIEPLRRGLMEVFLDGEIRRIATQEGRERRRDEEDLTSDPGHGHPN